MPEPHLHTFGLPQSLRQLAAAGDVLNAAPKDWTKLPAQLPDFGNARASSSRLHRTADPEQNQRDIANDLEYASRAHQAKNPITERHEHSVLRDWEELVPEVPAFVGLTGLQLWRSSVVSIAAPFFLKRRLEVTRGRNSRYVKAITLGNWNNCLIRCIVDYCHDEEGKRCGSQLLAENGLFGQLRALCTTLVREKKLIRTSDSKQYWNQYHAFLMISHALHSSQNTTRDERPVRFMQAFLINAALVCSLRTGSFGPSCPEYAERDSYIKMGDVVFHCHDGPFVGWVAMRVQNWKTQSDAFAIPVIEYPLHSPKRPHNAMFNGMLWLGLYMFWSRAFGDMTWDEFLNYKGAELRCIDEFKDKPLFVKIAPGGHGLCKDEPATARHLSSWIADLAKGANLPHGNLAAFRRGAGNDFAIKLGSDVAKRIMGHGIASRPSANMGGSNTFFRYYDRGPLNLPLASVRLGELEAKTDDVTQESLRLNMLMDTAIDSLVNHVALTQAEAEHEQALADAANMDKNPDTAPMSDFFSDKSRLSSEGKQAVMKDPRVQESQQAVQEGWKRLLACFHPLGQTYKHDTHRCTPNIGRLFVNIPILVSPREAYEAKDNLLAAIQADQNIRRKASRERQEQEDEEARTEACNPARPANTAEARKVAQDVLQALPAKAIQDMVSTGGLPSVSSPGSLVAPVGSTSDAAWQSWARSITLERQHRDYQEQDDDIEEAIAADRSTNDLVNLVHRRYNEAHPQAGAALPDNIVPFGKQLQREADSDDMPRPSKKRRISETAEDVINIVADDEPPAVPGSIDEDEDELDILQLPMKDVYERLACALYKPILRNEQAREHYVADGERWICQLCKAYTHKPALATTVFPSLSKLLFHMDVHTPWKDLELLMRTEHPYEWWCPSCPFTAATLGLCRLHAIRSCPDSDKYSEMYTAHQNRRHARKPPSMETRKQRVKVFKEEAAAREQDDEDDSFDCFLHSDNLELTLTVREAFLDMRNWNVDAIITTLIEVKEIDPEHVEQIEDLRVGLTEMRKLAVEMFENPLFYSIPVPLDALVDFL